MEKYFKAPLQKNRFQNSAQKYVHGIPTNLTLFSYETQTPIYNWQLEEKYFAQTIELLKNKEIKTLDDFFAILDVYVCILLIRGAGKLFNGMAPH